MEAKTVHIISHSHWDREWYMPFEKFRMRLVKLLDRVTELLEQEGNGFHYFHLDGYVLLLEDYFEIRPEREERIRKLVQAGKLSIGPWYVLQDAFLTSGEAQVRNLEIGIRRAEELGGFTGIGYYPDTFGNISQSAQLLRGFEIDRAVFGRGINAVAENNHVLNQEGDGYPSELWWESPDGSRVMSVFMANWYHNGMELPTDPDEAAERGRRTLDDVERFATTPQLLLMNGCDHQPVQSDVGRAIEILNEVLPNYRFLHSRFDDYFNALQKHGTPMRTVKGELTSKYTDGWSTLVNTASARMYLKQRNARLQHELERWTEPFAAIAFMAGREYPEAFVRHAWKQLLQNHAHDSICGCSVDSVHEEMVTRFNKVGQIADTLSMEALQYLADQVDTAKLASSLEGLGASVYPFVVFNPLGWAREGQVTVDLDLEAEIQPEKMTLLGEDGRSIGFEWEDLGWIHGFTLPDDRFRVPWRKRRYRLTFHAAKVPAVGHATYLWSERKHVVPDGSRADIGVAPVSPDVSCKLADGTARLENAFLRIDVNTDGSLSMEHKESGHMFRDLLRLEDSGDIGNEYLYRAAEGSAPIVTDSDVHVVLDDRSTAGEACVSVKYGLELPAGRDGDMRSATVRTQEVELLLTLKPNARRAEAVVRIDNVIKDHRLRILFPSDLPTEIVHADAPFDVVARKIEPWSGWSNPSHCERMQTFVDVSDGEHGLMIMAEGLPEYEVLRDSRHTIALTLLRCVGELGDWNYFPTPGAQCIGEFSCRFAIAPHRGDYRHALREPQEFLAPMRAVATAVHEGPLASSLSWIRLDASAAVVATSLRKAEAEGGVQLRMVNISEEAEAIVLDGELVRQSVFVQEVLLNGKPVTSNERSDDEWRTVLPPKKLLTLAFKQ